MAIKMKFLIILVFLTGCSHDLDKMNSDLSEAIENNKKSLAALKSINCILKLEPNKYTEAEIDALCGTNAN